jgi:rsbT co-antagonist protein RsbR
MLRDWAMLCEQAGKRKGVVMAENTPDAAPVSGQLPQTPQLFSLLQTLVERLPIKIAIWHLEDADDPTSFRLMLSNYSTSALQSHIDMRAEVGNRIRQVFRALPDAILQRYVEILRSGQPAFLAEVPYDDERYGTGVMNIRAIPLSHEHLCISVEDITAQKQAEQAIRQAVMQEETIRAQQAMLAELSTPLIPISARVTVMPLIGAIDSARAQQVLETLLEGIANSGARIAILDITGVPVVDTQVANALIRAAHAVKLLGAEAILTGIRPEVAQTLVGLGADLSGITTHGSLQSAIAYATRQS